MRIAKPDTLADLGTLGLSLVESQQLLAGIQRETVAAQARVHAVHRPECRGCGAAEAGVQWPSHVRSTPELDRLRAQLSALMTYRTAAEVLAQLFPVDA